MPALRGTVALDTRDALKNLREFRREMREVSKTDTRVGVHLDTDVSKEIRKFKNDLAGISKLGRDHKIEIEAKGNIKPVTHDLGELRDTLKSIGRNPRVTVHLDTREVREAKDRVKDFKREAGTRTRLNFKVENEADIKKLREEINRTRIAAGAMKADLDTGEAKRKVDELIEKVRRLQGAARVSLSFDEKGGVASSSVSNAAQSSKIQKSGGLSIGKLAAGAALGNVAAAGVTAIVTGIKDGSKAILDFNRNQQQVLTGFQSQLGGSAKAARGLYTELQAMNDLSPFKEEAFIPNAQKLLGARMGLQDLRDTLRGVNEQTAALGGNSEKFSNISTALTQIYLKPKLGLEELTQQLIEHGVPAFDLLAKAYGTNTTQIQKWISKGMIPGKEAARGLANQMERQNFGAAAKQARSFDGALSTLTDRMKRGFGAATKDAFDGLTNLLNQMVYITGNKEFLEWAGRVAKTVGGGFQTVKTIVFDAVKIVANAEKSFLEYGIDMVGGWVDTWKKGAGFVWDYLKLTARNMAWFADTSSWLVQKGLGGAGDFFSSNLETGIKTVEEKAGQIKGFVKEIVPAFKELYGGLDYKKLLADADKYAKGLLNLGGKMPEQYKPKLGNSESDGEKARREAIRREKDWLNDLAKMYDAKAKAVVEGAKSEIDVMRELKNAFTDTFESIQREFVALGVINDPLGPMVSGFERLLNLGDRSKKVIADAKKAYGVYNGNAIAARERVEVLSGLDGDVNTKSGALSGGTGTKLVEAGKTAGSTLIKNLVKEFNDKSPRKLGASCADVASHVLDAIGYNLKYSPNARELMNNAKKAGWQQVPLGTAGALHVQTGANYGKVSRAHTTVGIGNGRVAGSSEYRYQEYDIRKAGGNPIALAPAGASTGIKPTTSTGVSKSAKSATTQTAITATSNTDGFDLEGISSALTGIKAIDDGWGKAVKNIEGNTVRFMLQTKLTSKESEDWIDGIVQVMSKPEFKKVLDDFNKRTGANLAVRGGGKWAANDFLRQFGNFSDYRLNQITAGDRADGALTELQKSRRMIGTSNNPLAGILAEFEAGGKYAGAQGKKYGLLDEQAGASLDAARNATKEATRAERDRISVLTEAKSALSLATVGTNEYEVALEKANRKFEVWRSPDISGLLEIANVFDELGGKALEAGNKTESAALKARAAGFRREASETADTRITAGNTSSEYNRANNREQTDLQTRNELGLRFKALKIENEILANSSLNEMERNERIEQQNNILNRQINLLKAGHNQEDAERLANDYSTLENFNKSFENRNGFLREYNSLVEQSAQAQQTFGDTTSTAIIRWRTEFGDLKGQTEDFKKRIIQATADIARLSEASEALNSARSQKFDLQKSNESRRLSFGRGLSDLQTQELDWKYQDKAARENIEGWKLDPKIEKERDAVRNLIREAQGLSRIERDVDRVTGAFDTMYDSVLSGQESFGDALITGFKNILGDMAKELIMSQARSAILGLFGGGNPVSTFIGAGAGPWAGGYKLPGKAIGVERVQKDNEVYRLHKSEMILSAGQAARYREQRAAQLSSARPSSSRSGSGGTVMVVQYVHNGNVVAPDPTNWQKQLEAKGRRGGSRPETARTEKARTLSAYADQR